MEVSTFADLQLEFNKRIQGAVYCSVATVDRQSRPRSRIMHPIWDGKTGWVISWPQSHKAKHLERNPNVSLAYIADSKKPVYIDAVAEWVDDEIGSRSQQCTHCACQSSGRNVWRLC